MDDTWTKFSFHGKKIIIQEVCFYTLEWFKVFLFWTKCMTMVGFGVNSWPKPNTIIVCVSVKMVFNLVVN